MSILNTVNGPALPASANLLLDLRVRAQREEDPPVTEIGEGRREHGREDK